MGIVANSDGRVEAAHAAAELFAASGVIDVIHAGDIGGRHVLEAFAPREGGLTGGYFVWGDRDHDRTGLMRYGQSLGLTCFGLMGEIEFIDKKLIVLHGDDKSILKKLIAEQQHDYIIHGHAMATEDQMVGKTRILNPGPLHGAAKSAMLLDPESGKVKLVAL